MEKGMKLSEAIQLGSMLRPQVFNSFGDPADPEGTCAMGAALEAVGRLVVATWANERRVRKIWPWLTWSFQPTRYCPYCHLPINAKTVFSLIIHLNDNDHLSRGQIAAVITEIEKQAQKQLEFVEDKADRRKQAGALHANLKGVTKWKPKHESADKLDDSLCQTAKT